MRGLLGDLVCERGDPERERGEIDPSEDTDSRAIRAISAISASSGSVRHNSKGAAGEVQHDCSLSAAAHAALCGRRLVVWFNISDESFAAKEPAHLEPGCRRLL